MSIGLMNIQFAIKGDEVYLIEVNPRASRTVPFVAKSVGSARLPRSRRGWWRARSFRTFPRVPISDDAAEEPLALKDFRTPWYSVKEAVMPFARFPGVDTTSRPRDALDRRGHGVRPQLPPRVSEGPAWRGHVPSDLGPRVPVDQGSRQGRGAGRNHPHARPLGFTFIATRGTAKYIEAQGIRAERVNKVYEGRPHIVDRMKNGDIVLVMNTTEGAQAVDDSRSMRAVALMDRIPYFTTLAASHAAALAMKAAVEGEIGVRSLQEA